MKNHTDSADGLLQGGHIKDISFCPFNLLKEGLSFHSVIPQEQFLHQVKLAVLPAGSPDCISILYQLEKQVGAHQSGASGH